MTSNSMLPLMMMDDDSIDFKTFFLYSNLLRQDCTTNTGSEFSAVLPLLLMQERSLKSSYKSKVFVTVKISLVNHD